MINNTMYTTGGKVQNPLAPPSNLTAKAGNAQVTLTWTDPPNTTVSPSGQTLAEWSYTRVVRKTGSQPTGPHDGELVVSSSVRDQYATTGYVDDGLTNDTLYYYAAFAYNTDGVASEGAFASATPMAGTPLSELAEGTLIKILENGAPVEFYLAKHNYEPTLNGEGRELVVRKDVYENVQWNSERDNNAYASSNIDSWFNTDYKNILSSGAVSLIGSTNFYYTIGGGNNSVSVLGRSIFALSMTELGETGSYANVEGSTLPIAEVLKYPNFTSFSQWTRTCHTNISAGPSGDAWVLNPNGSVVFPVTSAAGARPCFTLPSTAPVDQDLNLIEV